MSKQEKLCVHPGYTGGHRAFLIIRTRSINLTETGNLSANDLNFLAR